MGRIFEIQVARACRIVRNLSLCSREKIDRRREVLAVFALLQCGSTWF
jgi:hypothetical protein